MTGALQRAGCKIIHSSQPDRAPFIVAFETATGERMGIIAYAFLATRTLTKNRPPDECSFQIKYGSKDTYAEENSHELWQDPLGMFTTLLVGIDPERGYCISADPVIHSPTKFFIRLEFKDEHIALSADRGWYAWQRVKRATPLDAPRVETLVGCNKEHFLDLVRFERAARGLDPGNRLILAEGHVYSLPTSKVPRGTDGSPSLHLAESHPLVSQFALSSEEILDLIAGARRLKMAVRGWVAEEHLRSTLLKVPGITHCERLDEEGGPDLKISFCDGPLLTVECKNVARESDRHGLPKIDFQRTRAAKGNPCSRYYAPTDFDIVAACLHGVTSDWSFRYALPGRLPPHKSCVGRIASNLRVDKTWAADPIEMVRLIYAARGVSV
ncbi:hypothetical protein CH341_07305 [Rhodoplanes roseus]|uniref:Methylase-associated X1 domain-containing protein n=2 Tax=Rhodoplanes roseus TaxID=29409 RepID=A0A327L442_9BRAD|nr:hypothetical protein CH341_07305 [Rhodoplanes roseus]